jgi:lysophospholipase L1-like esterase
MRARDLTARLLSATLLLIALAACNLFNKDDSPTSPSPVGPPAANQPVRYTAVGASDAIGIGASTVCVLFTPCENGTGYVPVLARRLRASREVTLLNLGIPGAVLSPTIHEIARRNGRDIPANFVEREMPFVATESTLVTIFGGGNDVNALADAIERGAAGSDVRGYIETQVRAFGSDYDRLVRGIRDRAPNAFIVILNLPNLAGIAYTSGYSMPRRQVIQQISVGVTRETNRQAGAGVVVVDLMCDPQAYDPSRFSSDGFHPNDAGYAYMAEKLLAVVNGGSSSPPSSCSQMNLVPGL